MNNQCSDQEEAQGFQGPARFLEAEEFEAAGVVAAAGGVLLNIQDHY